MARRYETTHPFLTFDFDSRELSSTDWLRLGEAASKCEHLARAPLRPNVAAALHSLFLVKGIAATTAIEGNTLNEQEVRGVIEGTLKLPPSRAYLGREVQNVLRACDDAILRGSPVLTVGELLSHHRVILEGLEGAPEVTPGELRRHVVGVGRYRAPDPEDVPLLVERLIGWLNRLAREATEEAVSQAVLRAILAHLYIAWIHPFGDGNGRTARLLELRILFHAGVPTPAAHLLSNHYNATRADYYRRLDEASRTGRAIGFVRYALQGFVDRLREQVSMVQEDQLRMAWESHVYRTLAPARGPGAERMRRVAVELGRRGETVNRSEIARLSIELAHAYGGKTDKSLSRDLNGLSRLGLVESPSRGHWRARTELVLGFLPRRGGG